MADGATVAVRQAVPADAEAIGAVHARAWDRAYRGVLPDAVIARVTPERQAELWGTYLRQAAPAIGTVVVAEAGEGQVEGFASWTRGRRRAGRLLTLYVDPSRHGCGIGTALVAAVDAELVRLGCREVRARCLMGNPYRRFYRRTGWRLAGLAFDRFGGTLVWELVFRRRLADASPHAS